MQENDVAEIITRQSKTNFATAINILPEHKRAALNTVYAFCRCTDDIVDEGNDKAVKSALLIRWRNELELGLQNKSEHALLNQLSVIARKFNIPVSHFFDLIRGMEMDLNHQRYQTFEDLYGYCYHVASTVGLMCSEIFGYKNESARVYAINLGVALQLTNIVRDVKSDAEMGRVYIPQEDFQRFDYTEEDLFACRYNRNFIELMRFETQRAREYYVAARTHLAGEDHKAFFAARIMDRIYWRILEKIERKHFRVFEEKITISKFSKLMIALQEYLTPAPVGVIQTT